MIMKRNGFIEGLGVILTRHNLLAFDDLKSLTESFRRRDDIEFEDFLIEEEIVSKPELLEALSEYYNVPAFDVVGAFFDHQYLRLIPKSIMLKYLFIPYERTDDTLTVVAADPSDVHLRPVIGQYVTHNLNIVVGLAQDIRDTVREFYDKSITYQPNDIENEQMERSAMDVHPHVEPAEELRQENRDDEPIPTINQETVDDYEK